MFSWTQPFGFPACDSFMEPVYPDLAGHLGVSGEEQGSDSWRAPRPSGVRVLFNPPSQHGVFLITLRKPRWKSAQYDAGR
jgi:hypothetical protein